MPKNWKGYAILVNGHKLVENIFDDYDDALSHAENYLTDTDLVEILITNSIRTAVSAPDPISGRKLVWGPAYR